MIFIVMDYLIDKNPLALRAPGRIVIFGVQNVRITS